MDGQRHDTGDWTTRVTHTIDTGASSIWKLEYNPPAGNVSFDPDLLPNTYYVSRNGSVLFTWTDTGNAVSHGRGRRFGGLMVTSQGLAKSGRIDNFNFYDVAA